MILELRNYEMMLVVRGDIAEDQLSKTVSDYQQALASHSDVDVKEWGKRKMAFPMNHVADGFYALMTFSTDKDTLKSAEDRMKLDANVLRYMVVRLDESETVAAAN